MDPITKYRNKKAEADEELKHTGDLHERERLIELSKIYGEMVRDLEDKRGAGLKWGEVDE